MTDRISNEEAHELWSQKQLMRFRKLKNHGRLHAVKSGALEHWTEAARNEALDLLGEHAQQASPPYPAQMRKFEPALKALPPQLTHAPRLDRLLIAAGTGWAVIMLAAAGRAYWFF